MQAGDLVRFEEGLWLVLRTDANTRLALMISQSGTRAEVPDDLDAREEGADDRASVVANPAKQWPMIAFPTKRGTGPLMSIAIPNQIRARELKPWEEWIPSDPTREGGVLHFHPDLGLRHGQMLIGTFRNGTKTRIVIPKNFGTVAQRQVPVTQKFTAVEESTRFNRDLFEDDDA